MQYKLIKFKRYWEKDSLTSEIKNKQQISTETLRKAKQSRESETNKLKVSMRKWLKWKADKKGPNMNNCSPWRSKQNIGMGLVFKCIFQDNFLEIKEKFNQYIE